MLTVKSFYGQINQGTGTSPSYGHQAWTSQTSAADNQWTSVTYGNGLFVAVSRSGTNNRVMTSPDGITWTSRKSAADNEWTSVTWGNGLFVAVSRTGTGNRVMTSPDGITWTIRTSAVDNSWQSVTWGNGLFVAVSQTGTGNLVMTSPDGITWTSRTSAADNLWRSVTWGNGLFVAVSRTGTGNRVMTSPDGITWTIRTSAADISWWSVTYGNGLFVAVSADGSGNRVMTSPDGITWTIRTSAADNAWVGVTYGNGLFVAVSFSGVGNRVMTSPDGITWTIRTSAVDNQWTSVTYGNGLFVAVAETGTDNRVMTWIWPIVSPILSVDSTNLVTYGTTFPMGSGTGGTGTILTYNPNTYTLSYTSSTNVYRTNDMFTLAVQAFGSTMKANNVMAPSTALINGDFTLAGSGASALYTTTVYVPTTSYITGVTFYQKTAGVYTANNTNGVGLYQFQGVTGTLLTGSTGHTGLYTQTSGTFYSQPFSAPLTLVQGDYTVAFLYSNSTSSTTPILGGTSTTAGFINIPSFNLTNGATLSGFITTQTSLPNPLMTSNLTQTAPTSIAPWAVLY